MPLPVPPRLYLRSSGNLRWSIRSRAKESVRDSTTETDRLPAVLMVPKNVPAAEIDADGVLPVCEACAHPKSATPVPRAAAQCRSWVLRRMRILQPVQVVCSGDRRLHSQTACHGIRAARNWLLALARARWDGTGDASE